MLAIMYVIVWLFKSVLLTQREDGQTAGLLYSIADTSVPVSVANAEKGQTDFVSPAETDA